MMLGRFVRDFLALLSLKELQSKTYSRSLPREGAKALNAIRSKAPQLEALPLIRHLFAHLPVCIVHRVLQRTTNEGNSDLYRSGCTARATCWW